MDLKRKPSNLGSGAQIKRQKKGDEVSTPDFLMEDVEATGVEEGQGWERKKLSPVDPRTYSVIFQQLDAEYTMSDPVPGMPGLKVGPVPVIRMFGCTAEGHSVLARIHSFLPYFYIPVPPVWNNRPGDFRKHYDAKLRESMEGKNYSRYG
tara:strand:+ start:2240 stop:2689 length:450 start_codon:yes stop_codon:yes gene_type:complete